jgi:hypothetical protein
MKKMMKILEIQIIIRKMTKMPQRILMKVQKTMMTVTKVVIFCQICLKQLQVNNVK